MHNIRDSLLRRVARRRNLVVPSLLADRRTYEITGGLGAEVLIADGTLPAPHSLAGEARPVEAPEAGNGVGTNGAGSGQKRASAGRPPIRRRASTADDSAQAAEELVLAGTNGTAPKSETNRTGEPSGTNGRSRRTSVTRRNDG
jgi:hypothetical protein